MLYGSREDLQLAAARSRVHRAEESLELCLAAEWLIVPRSLDRMDAARGSGWLRQLEAVQALVHGFQPVRSIELRTLGLA